MFLRVLDTRKRLSTQLFAFQDYSFHMDDIRKVAFRKLSETRPNIYGAKVR